MLRLVCITLFLTIMVTHTSAASNKVLQKQLANILSQLQATEAEKAAGKCPEGTVKECVDPNAKKPKANPEPEGDGDNIKLLETRLADFEQELDEIINFLSSEKKTDKVLKVKSDKVIGLMEDEVEKTDAVIDKLKEDVSDKLEEFEKKIEDVNESAQMTINSEGVVFYGRVGSSCSTQLDNCLDSNAQCRSGKCQCLPGYSMDMSNRVCTSRCPTYGHTYQSVDYHIIRGYNSDPINNVTDFEECKRECEEETDFVCRTIDYFPRWSLCFLSNYTLLDVPDTAWEYSSVGMHFQRDCA